jgi:serine/threonine-protein kinase
MIEAGHTIGAYRVTGLLGQGGMGAVYIAEHSLLGRKAAIKVLLPAYSRDAQIVQRFFNEAKAVTQLSDPGIVQVFDFGTDADGSAYIVMELLDGETVAGRMDRLGRMPTLEAVRLVRLVCVALHAAHVKGIIHRDLKPENVLIDRYRRWRLADFGIANVAGEEIAGPSGTPAFASPEQLLGESQDAAADCFSLAAIVAFAMTGVPPFGDRDNATILARELRGDVDLSEYQPEIAAWLRRGLAAAPEDRFEDAAAMQTVWREAVQAVFERERQVPWWRRWFGSDGAGVAWTGDATFTN